MNYPAIHDWSAILNDTLIEICLVGKKNHVVLPPQGSDIQSSGKFAICGMIWAEMNLCALQLIPQSFPC